MAESALITTRFLVLRKTPYSDSSWVVAGISPEHGQLHFMVRGGRRVGKRRFPLVDVFRLLEVQFRSGKGELHSWQSADLVSDFCHVARRVEIYQAAAWLARFALANLAEGVAHPRYFCALTIALGRLAEAAARPGGSGAVLSAAMTGTSLVYLQEAGILADFSQDQRTARQCAFLLQMALGEREPPRLTEKTWQAITEWTLERLQQAECSLPLPWPPGGANDRIPRT